MTVPGRTAKIILLIVVKRVSTPICLVWLLDLLCLCCDAEVCSLQRNGVLHQAHTQISL